MDNKALGTDHGSSLAAVLMVMMAVVVIGTTSLAVSQHANNATSVDRERLQAIQAAEAGAHDAIRGLETGTRSCNSALSEEIDLADGGGTVSSYRNRIEPTADPMTCLIHSWGFAVTGGTRAMRQVEVQVQLVPQTGFPYTIFAQSGTLEVWNTGILQGDAYAFTLDPSSQKNKLSAQNYVSPGSLQTQNNAAFSGTIWVGGNVTLGSGSTVARSVTAAGTASGAAGTIVLGGNSFVGGDAKAKSSVTLGNGAVVQGSISQNNSNVAPPPTLVKPAFDPGALAYTFTGTAAQVTTELNRPAVRAAMSGTYRATDGGTVSLPTSANITGDVTVVANGKISLTQSTLTGSGTQRLTLVSFSTATDAISANQFRALQVHTLLYAANGGIELKNSVEMTGAIYANTISLKNSYALYASQVLKDDPPPGFTFDQSSATEFLAVPTIWREVVPGTPPV